MRWQNIWSYTDQARRELWPNLHYQSDPRCLWSFLGRIGAVTHPPDREWERERAKFHTNWKTICGGMDVERYNSQRQSLAVFRSRLKTYLFSHSFLWLHYNTLCSARAVTVIISDTYVVLFTYLLI